MEAEAEAAAGAGGATGDLVLTMAPLLPSSMDMASLAAAVEELRQENKLLRNRVDLLEQRLETTSTTAAAASAPAVTTTATASTTSVSTAPSLSTDAATSMSTAAATSTTNTSSLILPVAAAAAAAETAGTDTAGTGGGTAGVAGAGRSRPSRLATTKKLASAASALIVQRRYSHEGSPVHRYDGHTDAVWDVTSWMHDSFSPHGIVVGTASADGSARLWQVGGGGGGNDSKNTPTSSSSSSGNSSSRNNGSGNNGDDAIYPTLITPSALSASTSLVHSSTSSPSSFSSSAASSAMLRPTSKTLEGSDANSGGIGGSSSSSSGGGGGGGGGGGLQTVLNEQNYGSGGRPKCFAVYTGHGGSVNSIRIRPGAPGPNGSITACSAGGDGEVHIWHATLPNTYEQLTQQQQARENGGDVLKNETVSALLSAAIPTTASSSLSSVRLRGHTAPVMTADWLAGGNAIASGSGDRLVKLWDVSTGTAVTDMAGHEAAVNHVSAHASDPVLLSASRDATFRLWDLRQAGIHQVCVFQAHEGAVNAAVFCGSGGGGGSSFQTVLSAGDDRSVKIWDTRNMRVPRTVLRLPDAANRIAVSPSGRLVAAPLDNMRTRVMDLTGAKVAGLPRGRRAKGAVVVGASARARENGGPLHVRHTRAVSAARWLTEDRLITAGLDGTVIEWRIGLAPERKLGAALGLVHRRSRSASHIQASINMKGGGGGTE